MKGINRMKKILTAIILAAMLLCACSKKAPDADTALPVTDNSGTVAADTTCDTTEAITEAETEPLPPPEPKVSSFYELNGTHPEGTHTDMTSTSYLEADFRSRIELPESLTKATTPYYTRVKQLSDGTYILFYNDEKNGKGVRQLTSEDGINWGGYKTVFEQSGKKRYANPDAIVLQNGDLLVCTAWRYTDTYYTDPTKGGISIKRSTDNGKTWGKEQVIFLGINWEPYFLQLRSGELQIYWTNTTNHVLPSGKNQSTGTAILRSFDNGETWTGSVTVPYSGQVVAKQATEKYDGVQFYTDQMPVAIELQNGSIALAIESRLDRKSTYRVSMAYSHDNWATAIPADEEGPEDKLVNKFVATAPYIRQFPSGEVILRYSRLMTSTLLLADPTAHNFAKELVKLDNMRGWGNIELIDNMHTALVCSTARYNEGKTNEVHKINFQKVNLNHTLFSPANAKITVDGVSTDWHTNKDALFVGSASQAQASYRFARNPEGTYLLIDYLDYDLTDGDKVTLRIALPDNILSYINVTVSASGITDQFSLRNGVKTQLDLENGVTVFGTVGDNSDEDVGFVAEIKLPNDVISGDLAVYPSLYNEDTGIKGITDMPDMFPQNNNTRWIGVKFN